MVKKTRVLVTIKQDVLDPAGVAIKQALATQGVPDIELVRVGKVIDISFRRGSDAEKNLSLIHDISKNLLSNPIVEDYAVSVIDENQDE